MLRRQGNMISVILAILFVLGSCGMLLFSIINDSGAGSNGEILMLSILLTVCGILILTYIFRSIKNEN